jgi:hypothetical protein
MSDTQKATLLLRSAAVSETPEDFLPKLVALARQESSDDVLFSSVAQTILWIVSTRTVVENLPLDVLVRLALHTDSSRVLARLRGYAVVAGLPSVVDACDSRNV